MSVEKKKGLELIKLSSINKGTSATVLRESVYLNTKSFFWSFPNLYSKNTIFHFNERLTRQNDGDRWSEIPEIFSQRLNACLEASFYMHLPFLSMQ